MLMKIHGSYITLICVDKRFQRNLNRIHEQHTGNAFIKRFYDTNTLAVL